MEFVLLPCLFRFPYKLEVACSDKMILSAYNTNVLTMTAVIGGEFVVMAFQESTFGPCARDIIQ